jgi:hypothetical protein
MNSHEHGTDPNPRRWVQFATFAVLLAVGAVLAVWYQSGYMPGSLRIENDGLWPTVRGTGSTRDRYPSGSLKSQHWFRAGRRMTSEWYLPDGTLFARTEFHSHEPGRFYQLRDDGSVSDRFYLLNDVPHGEWVHFGPNGQVEYTQELLHGIVLHRKEERDEKQ